MPSYRLYYLNQMGRIQRAEEFDAEDDVRAVRRVSDRAAGAPIELWCEGRRISQPLLSPIVPPQTQH
jgi:hypothetical protein